MNLMRKTTEALASAIAAKREEALRELSPIAGRLDCEKCHGAGVWFERPPASSTCNDGTLSIQVEEIIHVCDCVELSSRA